MDFLVLWSICWSSSLVHFKNRSEYLMRKTAPAFIPLIRFLLYSLVLSNFLVLQRYPFFVFSFISACLIRVFPSICKFPFLWAFCFFPSVICRFLLFIIIMVHFSMPNSIPISLLYILTVCIKVSNSFSFLVNSLMSSIYIRRLIFSCNLWSLYNSYLR